MKPMTQDQQACHELGLRLAHKQRKSEWPWIELLMRMHENKIHQCFEQRSLKHYAMNILKLNESLAICMVSVSGKCLEIPALGAALKAETLSVWTARRLVSQINNENAEELIEFAKNNTHAAIDLKVNPDGGSTRRVRNDVKTWIRKVQNLIAQKTGKHLSLDQIDLIVYQAYYNQHHPEAKAQRRQARAEAKAKAKPKAAANCEITEAQTSSGQIDPATTVKRVCANKHPNLRKITLRAAATTPMIKKRQPLTAEQKHAVHLRDGFRCTFVDVSGVRCDADCWLHIHHLKPVSEGGSNELTNLATLCSAHHDLCHQLSLPIERQVSWLR